MVKGACQAMGIRNMLRDLGVFQEKVEVKTDASAAIGIASRRGAGKVRHIETNQLWLQEKVSQGEIKVIKIKGTENPADHLTKALNAEGIKKHLADTNQETRQDRHQIAPEVQSGEQMSNESWSNLVANESHSVRETY